MGGDCRERPLDRDALTGQRSQEHCARKNTAATTADTGAINFDDHLRAEALIERLTRSFPIKAGGATALVAVIVDHDTVHHGGHAESVIEYFDGANLSASTLTRLWCDAIVQEVLHDHRGIPLAVGRQHRTASDTQRIALRTMYRSCAFPGCDRGFDHCQIHHVVPWEHGGVTDLANLMPLCSKHHHMVHDDQWTLTIDNHRTITVTTPGGTPYTVAPLTPDRAAPHVGRGADPPYRNDDLLDGPTLFRQPTDN